MAEESAVRLQVPADGGDLTAAWLAPLVGAVESVETSEVGRDLGMTGRTWRLRAAAGEQVHDLLVKNAPATLARREIAFYERCAQHTPIGVPRFYGGAVDAARDRGVIVLGFLSDARPGDVLAGCSRGQAEALARGLARLHGTWWGGADPALLGSAVEPAPLTRFRMGRGRLDATLDRHGASIEESWRVELTTIGSGLDSAAEVLAAGPITLLHNDYHLDNVVFAASGDPYVLDWQGVTVGPPAADLAQLLAMGSTEPVGASRAIALLGSYLEELALCGIDRDEVVIRREARAAVRLLTAGAVNWLGSPTPPVPGSRAELLALELLRGTMNALTELD